MKQIVLISIFAMLSLGYCQAQKFAISGIISDELSGETLIAANIFVPELEQGTSTNGEGFYSLTLPSGQHTLIYSYIGFKSDTLQIQLSENLAMDLRLKASTTLEEVVVEEEKLNRITEKAEMSTVSIPIDQIKTLPSFLGEVDILRTLQLMPGIQSAGELQSGILVRGGSRDQNLIILDGVPVYNVSHVLGLFSVFNADAIKSVDVIKGGFPARFGGRLSSIVDMKLKDGHRSEFHGSGAIGLISSKLMLEGPISKKSSFLISGRRTYADLLARPFIKANEFDNETIKPKFHFYDVNMKVNYKLNAKNTLFLSWYNGKDVFKTEYEYRGENYEEYTDVGPVWGNQIGSLRLNSQLGPKLFSNTRLVYSRYKMDFQGSFEYTSEDSNESYNISYLSGIEDIGFRTSIDYALSPDQYIRAGVSTTYHTYNPGLTSSSSKIDGETTGAQSGERLYAIETRAYVEDEFELGRLQSNVGLHFSHFNVKDENYFSVEPRVNFNYRLNEVSSIKASFARMKQYINLLSSEGLSLPSDFWVPSTNNLKPQLSNQIALGYAREVSRKFEFSAEAYYKTMENVVSYREGVSFFLSGLGASLNWEEKITQGDGEAYGMEFLFQKKLGRFTGWTSYTLSWNWREFEDINNGDRFPFRSDRRHDFSIVGNYKISDKIKCSASWIYQTGIAVSLPKGGYYDGITNGVFGSFTEKNNYRISPTHRLDLAIEFHKDKKRFSRAWVISVYNVYNYVSPFFVTTRYDNVTGGTENGRRYVEQGFLPILPTISYKFNF